MAATIVLNVTPRTGIGSGPARKLRRHGLVPAIVYGHGEVFPVSFSAKELHDALAGHSSSGVLITLKTDGRRDVTARVREFQFDTLGGHRLIHADFQIVTRDEAVRASVPVVTVGVAKGVKEFNGILDVVLHEIEVEGPAAQIPESIEVDVSELSINDHVSVGQLKLPNRVKAIEAADTLVVTVEASRIERELAEAAAAEEAGVQPVVEQPEVITRGKEEGTE